MDTSTTIVGYLGVCTVYRITFVQTESGNLAPTRYRVFIPRCRGQAVLAQLVHGGSALMLAFDTTLAELDGTPSHAWDRRERGRQGPTGWVSEKSIGFLVWIFSLIMYWSFLKLNFVVPTGGRNTSFILRCVVSSLFCWNLARFELWNGAELLQRFFPNDCRQLRECGAGSHSSVAATWEKVDADYHIISYNNIMKTSSSRTMPSQSGVPRTLLGRIIWIMAMVPHGPGTFQLKTASSRFTPFVLIHPYTS